jgi:ubiquinone biosynthesis protein UbiJ
MLSSLFITTLNHLLSRSPWPRERLMSFADRHVRLQLPIGALDFSFDDAGYAASLARTAGEPALTLTLSPSAAAAIADGVDGVMREVQIEGNADLAEELGFVLRNLRWDAEEDLSRFVGDAAAHRIYGTATSALAWHADTLRRAATNLRDFLVAEAPTVVDHSSMESWLAEVAEVRDDLARLEKRLARLESRTA